MDQCKRHVNSRHEHWSYVSFLLTSTHSSQASMINVALGLISWRTQLLCHVQNLKAITSLQLRREQNEISVECKLRWKNHSWNGPQHSPLSSMADIQCRMKANPISSNKAERRTMTVLHRNQQLSRHEEIIWGKEISSPNLQGGQPEIQQISK